MGRPYTGNVPMEIIQRIFLEKVILKNEDVIILQILQFNHFFFGITSNQRSPHSAHLYSQTDNSNRYRSILEYFLEIEFENFGEFK